MIFLEAKFLQNIWTEKFDVLKYSSMQPQNVVFKAIFCYTLKWVLNMQQQEYIHVLHFFWKFQKWCSWKTVLSKNCLMPTKWTLNCIHLTIYKLGSRQSHGHNINNFPTSNEMHLFCVLNIFLQIFWVALIWFFVNTLNALHLVVISGSNERPKSQ